MINKRELHLFSIISQNNNLNPNGSYKKKLKNYKNNWVNSKKNNNKDKN